MPRIIQNMNWNQVSKAAKKNSAKKEIDTLGAIEKAFPDVLKLEPGQGLYYNVPKDVKPASFLGQARAKLTSARREGQPWAGRDYRCAIAEDGRLAIYRDVDTGEALPVKKGGRPTNAELEARKSAGNGSVPPGTPTFPDENTVSPKKGGRPKKDAEPTGQTLIKDLTQ